MEARAIKQGNEAREATKNAINFLGDIVCSTLGPGGKNAVLDRDRDDRPPMLTNDGVTIAEELYMEDECENVVMRNFVEAAKRTNDVAGDGTTTAITIGRRLTNDALEKLGDFDIVVPGAPQAMPLARQIEDETRQVVEELNKMSTPVNTLNKLKDVAYTSLEDKEVSDKVAEAVYKVGKNGFTTLEQGFNREIEVETQKGMQIYAKYADALMVTNRKRKEAVISETPVIVSNATVVSMAELNPVIQDMNAKRQGKDYKAIVVMAAKFEATAIQQAFKIYAQSKEQGSPFQFFLVKVPSLTNDELEDVAAFLDAKFINCDATVGMNISKTKFEDIGYAKKVVVGADETVLIGGRGLTANMTTPKGGAKRGESIPVTTRVTARIKELEDIVESETDDMFKKKAERRLGILTGGISVIKVDAKSEIERVYLKLKIEDAINACKGALQEGVVQGGGLALKAIADKKEFKDFFILDALREPHTVIANNAGGDITVGDDIIDPVKVTRASLENAVSVVKSIITNSTIIAYKRRDVSEELREMIAVTSGA